jgi:integrase
MARLFKRPDRGNTYWYDFTDPRTGRRRRVNTGCTSKAEAEAFVQDLWARLKGLVQDTETVHLSQALEEFLAVRGPALKSAWRHRQALGHVIRILGDIPLRAITPARLYAYQAKRLKEKTPRGTPVSPTTVRRELLYLSSLMTFAVKRGWVEDNPVRKVEKPRESPPRQDCFTPEEIRRLLNTPTTPPMRMAFLLSLMMGLRRGEILRLRRSDVLPDVGLIVIRNDKSNRTRTVPIPPPLVPELRAYMEAHDFGEQLFPWKGVGSHKTQVPAGFKTAWRSWLRRAGVRPLRFHDVRHAFATFFAQNVGNLHELARILGHGSAYVTQRYAHYLKDYHARLAAEMGRALASVLDFSQIGTKMAPSEGSDSEERPQYVN